MTSPEKRYPSLYIHIPFCRSKCGYCDFYSETTKNDYIDDYIDALDKESRYYTIPEKLSSVFIGGGNPAILTTQQLKRLFSIINRYSFEKAEYTIEANPESIHRQFIETILEAGVNRISLGVQSFQEDILKTLERNCTRDYVYRSIELIRENFVLKLNLDIIWAIPGQKLSHLKADINELIKIAPEHISAYSLMLSPGTKLSKMIKMEIMKPVSDGMFRKMYFLLRNKLEEAGYHFYEVSNYALPGNECKHNAHYWEGNEYIGLGAGASGYLNDERYSNSAHIMQYIQSIQKNGRPEKTVDTMTPYKKWLEYVMLSLRTAKGLDTEILIALYQEKGWEKKHSEILARLEHFRKTGYLLKQGTVYSCTRSGFLLLDSLIRDLILED